MPSEIVLYNIGEKNLERFSEKTLLLGISEDFFHVDEEVSHADPGESDEMRRDW